MASELTWDIRYDNTRKQSIDKEEKYRGLLRVGMGSHEEGFGLVVIVNMSRVLLCFCCWRHGELSQTKKRDATLELLLANSGAKRRR